MKTWCARWSGPPGALLVYTCSRSATHLPTHRTPRSSSPHPTILYFIIIVYTIYCIVVALSGRCYTYLHHQQLSRKHARFALARARVYTMTIVHCIYIYIRTYCSSSCLANNIVIKTGS